MTLTSLELEQRLRDAFARPRLSIEFVSDRASHFASRAMLEALTRHFQPLGFEVALCALRDAVVPSSADVVLFHCKLRKQEPAYLAALRQANYGGVVVGWFWDNHHAKDANRQVAALVDMAIATHESHAAFLAERAPLLPSVLIGTLQWASDEARSYWASLDPAIKRSEELYGGFGRYKGSARTPCLERLIASGRYPALRFDDDPARPDYFKLTGEARFLDWAGHAVSLCLPYRDDLSARFFDAWLTGQIPVVTPDIAELTSAWAAAHRDRHFVCASSYEPADIAAAHQRALALFRAGGPEAQRARHQLVLDGHMFHHRIEQIVELLRQVAHQGIGAVARGVASHW